MKQCSELNRGKLEFLPEKEGAFGSPVLVGVAHSFASPALNHNGVLHTEVKHCAASPVGNPTKVPNTRVAERSVSLKKKKKKKCLLSAVRVEQRRWLFIGWL